MKHLLLLPPLLVLSSTIKGTSASNGLPQHRPALFLQASKSKSVASRLPPKGRHPTSALFESPGDGSARNRALRRSRPPRRRRPAPSSHPSTSRRPNQRRPRKPGPSNVCPPLDGKVGAPALPVVTTNDPRIVQRWLEDNRIGTDDKFSVLGFDTESIAKPPWKPERASLPDGPATLQLATPTSCLIVQLSVCGDGSARHAPDALREVINDPRIIKVGVGIDDDALELYRWSKESANDATITTSLDGADEGTPQLWEMTSRFDLGCIGSVWGASPSRRSGLRELAEKILGVTIHKSKRLSMSNWGKRFLDTEQISYAARDAWVAAAIVERLQQEDKVDVFGTEALIEMEFMANQRSMEEVDERAALRKAAKQEFKLILEKKKADGKLDTDDRVRKEELQSLLESYRPDQPPTFNDDAFSIQLF